MSRLPSSSRPFFPFFSLLIRPSQHSPFTVHTLVTVHNPLFVCESFRLRLVRSPSRCLFFFGSRHGFAHCPCPFYGFLRSSATRKIEISTPSCVFYRYTHSLQRFTSTPSNTADRICLRSLAWRPDRHPHPRMAPLDRPTKRTLALERAPSGMAGTPPDRPRLKIINHRGHPPRIESRHLGWTMT